MRRNISKFIYWTPRILSILFIAFLTMFSFDAFEPGRSYGEMAAAFLMHNIPVFVLMAALVVAWKREIVGTVAFFLAGIAYCLFVIIKGARAGEAEWGMLSWPFIIAVPAFFIGWMFWIGWRNRST